MDEFADDEYFLEHPEEFSIYEGLYELDVDLRSVHGSVILTPVDSNDLKDQRVVRVEYSEEKENYVTVVTDGAGEDVYSAVLNDIDGVAWSEFVSNGEEYYVEIVADEGYFLHNCSVLNNNDLVVADSVEADSVSYACKVVMNGDVDIIANFSDSDENALADEPMAIK